MSKIAIAKDFSDAPVGRYPADGEFNGERFREEFLVPALSSGETVTVNIDEAEGYGSSFLDEAFGGLVYKGYYTPQDLKAKLIIESRDPDYAVYKALIWKYINDARPE